MSIVYLRPIGVLNVSVGSSLLSQIESELDKNVTKFHLDCSAIDSIDEAGVKTLLQALSLISSVQGRLIFFSLNDSVRIFFEFRGLDFVFDIVS